MPEIKMAVYQNRSDRPVKVVIGRRPGQPPLVYEAAPGGFVEGPESYAEVFRREGPLVLSSAEARDKAEAQPALPKTEAKAPEGAGVTIGGKGGKGR